MLIFLPDAFGMTDIHLLQTALGGTRATTPKAVFRLALDKTRTVPLLELALELRRNRKTRCTVGDLCVVRDCVRPPRWLIVLQKQLFSLYNVGRVLTYPHAERATGVFYRGSVTQSIRRKLAMAWECSIHAPTISEVATIQATHMSSSASSP